MASVLQEPVFALPGCQHICLNNLLRDALGLADYVSGKPICRRTTRTNPIIKMMGCSICRVTMGKPFKQICFALIFAFSARIFAKMFCTEVLRRFFARIFCTDLLHRFFVRFLAWISARFLQKFFEQKGGVTTCWATPKFQRENPLENSPCFAGLPGRGFGTDARCKSATQKKKTAKTGRTGNTGEKKGLDEHLPDEEAIVQRECHQDTQGNAKPPAYLAPQRSRISQHLKIVQKPTRKQWKQLMPIDGGHSALVIRF